MHPLGDDVIEALTELKQLDFDPDEAPRPLFNPKQLDDNVALTDTQDFVLSQEKLLEWGARVTEIRKKIMTRAAALQDP